MLTRRVRLTIGGVVQGVGFRPFVHALASDLGLTGQVGNDSAGVYVEAEGRARHVDEFIRRIEADAPSLARVASVEVDHVPPIGGVGFTIVESVVSSGERTLLPPDASMCSDCAAEMTDPADRRYRYPFINCTNCGPRFTIITDLPYDRPNTTMDGFEMCPDCWAEYSDPSDRRYHAQPVACPACGPALRFERLSGAGSIEGTDEVLRAVHEVLAAGEVVAIKGIGGYHLACNAADNDAVRSLRRRKGRNEKPFAVMVPDIDAAEALAVVSEAERRELTSVARPIVLLERRSGQTGRVVDAVAPGNPLLGVMIAYSPLHQLLFERVPGSGTAPPEVLVMTSGNRSEEPICFDEIDARSRLADLADAFCTHDRPIHVPCDDSVVRVVDGELMPIRRSRGYAPLPVSLPVSVRPVVAAGGELKNTACVARGRQGWVTQHIGDMENLETLAAFGASVDAYRRMYAVSPEVIAADMHPGYMTHSWAKGHADESRLPVVEVQHHHAHVAALMAEHQMDGSKPLLGFAFDGTGFGLDPTGVAQAWGGEVLLADYSGFERVAHLRPLPLPGGDAGVRNPCRTAVAYCLALGIEVPGTSPARLACDDIELRIVTRQVERNVGCTATTSMGRLFDVVSSLLGVRHRISYEGQAAIELEAAAASCSGAGVELEFGLDQGVIDPAPVLQDLIALVADGVPTPDLALGFHEAVAGIVSDITLCQQRSPIGLTGGVFQNALLVRLVKQRLVGFDVLTHRLVPPNDGGLALGQAVVAGLAAVSEYERT